MADRNLAEIGGKRRRHRRQRVAVDEYPVGPLGIETFTEPGDKAREQRVERLVGLHDVKVDVGDDARDMQHLVENLAMLRGHADARIDAGLFAQCVDAREHLTSFRPRKAERRVWKEGGSRLKHRWS